MQEQTYFYCEHGQTLAQVAQSGCSISILGDTQHSRGHGPGKPAVALPTLSKGLVLGDLRRCLPASPFLWGHHFWKRGLSDSRFQWFQVEVLKMDVLSLRKLECSHQATRDDTVLTYIPSLLTLRCCLYLGLHLFLCRELKMAEGVPSFRRYWSSGPQEV